MKFLERGVYKVFAGLVLVSMIGALVAEPVALGDIAAYYLYEHSKNGEYSSAVQDGLQLYNCYRWGIDGAGFLSRVAAEAVVEDGLLAAGVATGGVGLIALGVGIGL
ncbi:MAG: hypothetical protein GXN95_02110 [Methanococci archaeon]|nr:hypothetical protein [Methanococci archaeon]